MILYFADTVSNGDEVIHRFDDFVNKEIVYMLIETDNPLKLISSSILKKMDKSKQLVLDGIFEWKRKIKSREYFFKWKNESGSTIDIIYIFEVGD